MGQLELTAGGPCQLAPCQATRNPSATRPGQKHATVNRACHTLLLLEANMHYSMANNRQTHSRQLDSNRGAKCRTSTCSRHSSPGQPCCQCCLGQTEHHLQAPEATEGACHPTGHGLNHATIAVIQASLLALARRGGQVAKRGGALPSGHVPGKCIPGALAWTTTYCASTQHAMHPQRINIQATA